MRAWRALTVTGEGLTDFPVPLLPEPLIEIVDQGAAQTAFMRFGDRVRMVARDAQGQVPFGAIDQRVVAADLARAGDKERR
ncbi:MAG: hypothetical protein GAK30_03819 [Paracidovorax wautersii]|uniref:Uncharacterized protein n=1 Tax=Paracidovorax wautersii TaxID=1177982 RepID=A0A7V8FKF5_9BURK|nr:MAG: hypothetical protein GAK30_03819 [Paracidovorax wautersii]